MSQPDEQEQLPPEDAARLRKLRVSVAPPGDLEDIVVARMRRAGAFDRPPSRRVLPWLALTAAAAAIAFILGTAAGRGRTDTSPPGGGQPGTQFAMVLLNTPNLTALAPEEARAHEEAVRHWVSTLRSEGTVLAGGSLGPEMSMVTADPTFTERHRTDVGALLFVVAEDLSAAEALARASPHVEYGGVIGLQPVR